MSDMESERGKVSCNLPMAWTGATTLSLQIKYNRLPGATCHHLPCGIPLCFLSVLLPDIKNSIY